jgi:thiamine-monophosphate kinase
MPSEFELIARHFTRPAAGAVLGVGDDAALLAPSPGRHLVVSTDMLLADRHFFADTDPGGLGHKTLAVNLSDLAAMGARPRWATLALALPAADEAWLDAFSRGFFALAERFRVDLVGGDTTRGPLALSVTLLGEVAPADALRRDAARPGDDIWVSGELGGAALGLAGLRGELTLTATDSVDCLARLHRPEPRVDLGLALTGLAHAAIDLSDGLLADLGHILARSGVGARVELARLPAHPALAGVETALARHCLLAGGDDYELCFTAPPGCRPAILDAGAATGVAVTRIGRIEAGSGLSLLAADGGAIAIEERGYDHFGA